MLEARHSSFTSHFWHALSAACVDFLSLRPGKKISESIPMHSALSSHSSLCILCLSVRDDNIWCPRADSNRRPTA